MQTRRATIRTVALIYLATTCALVVLFARSPFAFRHGWDNYFVALGTLLSLTVIARHKLINR
jgi:uncharacterized membrane protein